MRKEILLGTTQNLKRGGYEPKRVKLLEPFKRKDEESVVWLFCTWCGRYYESLYETALYLAEFSELGPIKLPPRGELKKYFFRLGNKKTGGCVCCKGPGLKKISLESIEDLPQ